MVKVIFTTKESSTYDDRPWEYYHFPRTYLNQVQQSVGDLAIYYEPRRISADLSSRGGKQSYFAVCSVTRIEEDRNHADHYYAYVDNYMRFDVPVPFRTGDRYFETILKRGDGKTSKGAFGRAVRTIPDNEFDAIVRTGFVDSLLTEEHESDHEHSNNLFDVKSQFDRPLAKTIITRAFRDRAFRYQVQNAYDNRCAVTGLKLLNGGGHPEIEAAHIMPVADHGPDAVQNGVALSRTAHWMFDRGLISLSDDLEILCSGKYPLGDAERLINPDWRLRAPDDDALRPHPSFLKFHREAVFKV